MPKRSVTTDGGTTIRLSKGTARMLTLIACHSGLSVRDWFDQQHGDAIRREYAVVLAREAERVQREMTAQ